MLPGMRNRPPNRPPRPAALIGLLAALVCAPTAQGAPTVDFEAALVRAAQAPHLEGADAGLVAHAALARAVAGVDANPEVIVYPGWRLGPADSTRFELQAQLSQSFSVSGHVAARRDALQAERGALRAALDDARQLARRTAARTWIDAWRAQGRLDALVAAHRTATAYVEQVERAVGRHTATVDALADAKGAAAELALQVLEARGQVTDTGFALARALAHAAPEPLAAVGPLPAPTLPPADQHAPLLAQAAALPTARRARLLAHAADARVVESRRAHGARLTAGLMGQVDDGVVAFGMLGVTLPVDAGERDRAGLRADALAAQGRAATAERAAGQILARALHEVEHAEAVAAALDTDLIPALEALVAARERAVRVGQARIFALLRARARLARAQVARVDARAARAAASVDAWLLLASIAQGDP